MDLGIWGSGKFQCRNSVIGARVSDHLSEMKTLIAQILFGRSPGEFRNMDAHVFNNVVDYVNDEGMRVGLGGRVISEANVFDMIC